MDNDDHTAIGALADQLRRHETRSQERYEMLAGQLKTKSENTMEGINSDKVNINLGGGEGAGGGASIAAIIAALGNRNQGNDNAALIAALGNRNDSAANLGPLLAMMGNRRDDNDGMNNLWPILLLTLLRGRGGLGGDDCGSIATAAGLSPAQAAMLQTLLEGQSDLRADVPRTALETQNAIQQAVGALALGTQQGFANTKDAVQASLLANLTATSGVKDSVMNNAALLQRDICDVKSTVQTEACATRELVQAGTTAILSRIDRSEIDDLRHRADRAERAIEVNALRSQVEVNQTVTTTQAQGQIQGQVQAQFQDIGNTLRRVCDRLESVHQVAQAANSNIIAGNSGAVVSGPQTNTPTNVNSRQN